MNTTKTVAPERTMHGPQKPGWARVRERAKRFGRWAVLAACLAGCGASTDHRSTVTLSDGRSVPVIMLDRNRSDASIVDMRNYVSALSRILEKMVGKAVDLSRFYGEPPFEGAVGAIQVARTSQEVAREFVGRCNSALTSEGVSPEEMESLTSRYAFAHGLLVDAIVKFRDGLGRKADVRGTPASLGYPQIDLFSDF